MRAVRSARARASDCAAGPGSGCGDGGRGRQPAVAGAGKESRGGASLRGALRAGRLWLIPAAAHSRFRRACVRLSALRAGGPWPRSRPSACAAAARWRWVPSPALAPSPLPALPVERIDRVPDLLLDAAAAHVRCAQQRGRGTGQELRGAEHQRRKRLGAAVRAVRCATLAGADRRQTRGARGCKAPLAGALPLKGLASERGHLCPRYTRSGAPVIRHGTCYTFDGGHS